MEHTTLHLLYSRFWHKFLYDIGAVPTPEPYQKRTSQGMILGENGEKMSKSRGNVINPDDMVAEYGADAFRLYEMFMGAFDQAIPWSTAGVKGCRRFLERVWRMQDMVQGKQNPVLLSKLHKLIRKVSEDFESMKYNTAIAAMMAFANDAYDAGNMGKDDYGILLRLLAPAAPHIAEELWQRGGFMGLICKSVWPQYDPALCEDETKEIAVQVNGRVRGRITINADASEKEIEALALAGEGVKAWIEGKAIVKVIVVQGRIANIVVK
jgi:leucyl-tRNA synthetase